MKQIFKSPIFFVVIAVLLLGVVFRKEIFIQKQPIKQNHKPQVEAAQNTQLEMPKVLPLDVVAYEKKLNEIANNPISLSVATSTASSTQLQISTSLWPVKTVYPNRGALLPFNRIVAYYGNLYSKGMGILGEYSPDEVLKRLQGQVKKWQEADPNTPVIPAIHYIAVVAQAGPGKDGKFRARMPDTEIDKVLQMAEKINAIVFLDVQVGLSNVQSELPVYEKYLKMPNVHLGIDPEFSMKTGDRPGTVIGTMDASDINFAAEYLAKLVKENNLTPKILVVHRFTQAMVTNYKKITPLPEVQIVMQMDGFGGQGNKLNTYKQFIQKEPVQFTGFKIFYKNDANTAAGIFQPSQLLKLNPIPSYIQYQ